MTNQQHLITPPPELVEQWKRTAPNWYWANETEHYHYITLCAAQWGADQELEACCEWVDWKWSGIKNRELRAARRPKPPSLKEQALDALERYTSGKTVLIDTSIDTIRRALEALPND